MLTERLTDLILLFFSYAFIGWCIEVTLKYFQFHRFINRGFLTGPWLPIYGSGAALITIAVKGTAPLESSVGTTFVVSFLLCCAGGANVFQSFKTAQGAHMPGKTTKPRFGLI